MNDFAKKQTSQNSPVNPAISAESLEAMSPVELAEALELALDSMTEETYAPAVIDAYLDALDRKAPMPPAPDTEAAFQDFQRKLQSLSFEDKPTSGSRDSPAPSGKDGGLRCHRRGPSVHPNDRGPGRRNGYLWAPGPVD